MVEVVNNYDKSVVGKRKFVVTNNNRSMRIKIFCGAFLLLMLNVMALYAQPGEPCGGTDPDATCPLDTWVIVLAAVAVAFAAFHLARKQRLQEKPL